MTRDRYEQLAGRVKVLSWLSLAWMIVDGAVAIVAGILASSIRRNGAKCLMECPSLSGTPA